MDRFRLGAALLALLAGLGLWLSFSMERKLMPIADMLEASSQRVLAGQEAEGTALAEEAHRRWQACRNGIAAFSEHEPMEEIEGLFARLESYQGSRHYAACCAKLADLIRAVAEAHSPTWWNFLSGKWVCWVVEAEDPACCSTDGPEIGIAYGFFGDFII